MKFLSELFDSTLIQAARYKVSRDARHYCDTRLHGFWCRDMTLLKTRKIEMWLISAFGSEIWQCLKANVRVNTAKGAVINYFRGSRPKILPPPNMWAQKS